MQILSSYTQGAIAHRARRSSAFGAQPGKTLLCLLALCLPALALFGNSAIAETQQERAAPNTEAMLVIVMDDLGNNLHRGRRAIELPGALTYAILPHTPLAKKLAFYASHSDANKEIIIHMPMQPSLQRRTGPGALQDHQDRESFRATLQSAIDAVPFARGLNNHMGSALTRMPDRMDWLMSELAEHQLYFIDSRTTSQSAAALAADQQSIPHLTRDIFLDHHIDRQSIDKAFKRSIRMAQRHGLAVVLAHPYDQTLDYLEQQLPKVAEMGVELVTASEAIRRRSASQLAITQAPAVTNYPRAVSGRQLALRSKADGDHDKMVKN